jgi:cytochrome c peroxidase
MKQFSNRFKYPVILFQFLLATAISILLLPSCEKGQTFISPGFDFQIPEMQYPQDNLPTEKRIALGKKLFFDPVLSVDSSVSCASCHRPELAFTDGVKFSTGVFGRTVERNSPSLGNIGFAPYFMREGGVQTLETQVLVPIQEASEFNHNILEIAEKLNKDSVYVQQSLEAYGRMPDAFVITRAIAAFERTMNTFDSKFDKYLKSENSGLLSDSERNGLRLFYSDRLACSSCHGGILMTDFSFANNGLYADYSDPGKYRVSGREEDRAVFKVPSLRNIALTAPYMHDGSMSNLEQVIEHYASGGKSHPNKHPIIQGFSISETEKQDLINFLHALTDTQFINNPAWK